MSASFNRAEIEAHVGLIHQLAAGIKGVIPLFTVEEGKKPNIQRFRIGDVSGMANVIMGFENHPGLNIYMPLAVMRRDLEPNRKGGEKDVVAVLGAVGDIDRDKYRIGELPFEAPYVIKTSWLNDTENDQAFYPFARPLSVSEAKPILVGLSFAIGGDSATADCSHVWRVPGTLNWPDDKKLARGRSPVPQQVVIKKPFEGELVDPIELAAKLPTKKTNGHASPDYESGEALSDWQEADLINQLAAIPSDSRDVWIKVGMALHTIGRRDLWDKWSQKSSKFNAADQDRVWRSFKADRDGGVTTGTILKLAVEEYGWVPPNADWIQLDVKKPEPQEDGADSVQHNKKKLLRWLGDDPPEPPRWLADGVLPEIGVAIMGGQWSAGKTFAANNLSAAVLTGTSFATVEIYRRGGVLWLAAEGENEIDARMIAAIDATPLPEGFFSHQQMPFCVQQNEVPCLTDGNAFKRLCTLADEAAVTMCERFDADLALIVIDTLAAAAGFDDESSASETQAVMNILHRLSKHASALVLVIDHYGKLVETGVRGSSAKSGSADAILAVLADKAFEGTITNRRMAVVKLRGGPTGAVMPFALKAVPIADSSGTTCVIEWSYETLMAAPVKAERSPWTGKSKILKKAIEVAMIESGKEMSPFGSEGPKVKAVDREKVRAEFYASFPADGDSKAKQDTKRRTFNRLVNEVLTKGLIAAREVGGVEWIWLVSTEGEHDALP